MRSTLASLWFFRRIFVALVACSVLSGCALGCSTAGYLLQAGRGQLELSNRARPLSAVIHDEKTPPRTRELLARVPEIKAFGESKGLKATANYADYVELGRPSVVTVVSACAPFAFENKTWSFPIVGSMPYLGFFSAERAHAFAEDLKREGPYVSQGGYDIEVRGASAYSTLGWFKDPLLSSMLTGGEAALANVLLHESVHATWYINHQSAFNESLASFVADILTREWLAQNAAPEALAAYERREKSNARYTLRLHELYDELDRLYRSAEFGQKSLEQKREAKTRVMSRARQDLERVLGYSPELNNAIVAQFKTYNDGIGEFQALYESVGRSWPRFWAQIQTLRDSSFGRKQESDFGPVLRSLIR